VAFNVTAVTAPPHAPTALSATATFTSVTWSWTPALTGSAPSSFVVEIGTAAGTTTLPTQSVAWPATNLTLLLPAGTYYTRVRALNSLGSSPPSPETSIVVSEPSPIPGPPGNFWARTVGRTVSFTWTAATTGAAATSYTIEAGSAPGLANLAQLATGTPATSFDVPNVPAGTYWVRVRGSNGAGTGAPSQDVAIVMGTSSGCVGLPGAPVLLAPVTSGTNVALHWNPPTLGSLATGYVLMAGSGPGTSDLAVLGTGSAATSFAASAPPGLYFVRVAASNACGTGPASNEVSFTLGADLPGAPGDLAATVTAGGQVSLTWVPPATGGPATAYLLEAGSAPGLSDLAVISTGSPVTAFAAVAQPGNYYVRVRAVNGSGPGPASAEILVVVP
jgi:predicted phage tail protein